MTEVCPGVRKEVLRAGTGQKINRGDKIQVHATGSLAEGNKKFWSTKDPGQKPFDFDVGIGQVIKGWDEGCVSMTPGEVSRLHIDGHAAYGSRGFPAWGIGPNAALIFEIEILKVSPK